MGFGCHHPLAQHPRTRFGEGHKGVCEKAFAALAVSAGGVAVLAAVAAAEVARAGIGGAFGVDGHHGAVDVAVHHRHHGILDAIAITAVFTSHDHLGAHGISVTGGEGVGAMGLLKTAAHPVNRHFPELGGQSLVHLLIGDPFHLGLQVSTHLKAATHQAIVLLPAATALVAPEARLPGVAVLVGSTKGVGAIATQRNGQGAGGNGHGKASAGS